MTVMASTSPRVVLLQVRFHPPKRRQSKLQISQTSDNKVEIISVSPATNQLKGTLFYKKMMPCTQSTNSKVVLNSIS